jgi:hypothetical protein
MQKKTINTMEDRLVGIERHITTKTVDRYHGSDARRDFAQVNKEMETLRLEIRKLKMRKLPEPSPVTCPYQTNLCPNPPYINPDWISARPDWFATD